MEHLQSNSSSIFVRASPISGSNLYFLSNGRTLPQQPKIAPKPRTDDNQPIITASKTSESCPANFKNNLYSPTASAETFKPMQNGLQTYTVTPPKSVITSRISGTVPILLKTSTLCNPVQSLPQGLISYNNILASNSFSGSSKIVSFPCLKTLNIDETGNNVFVHNSFLQNQPQTQIIGNAYHPQIAVNFSPSPFQINPSGIQAPFRQTTTVCAPVSQYPFETSLENDPADTSGTDLQAFDKDPTALSHNAQLVEQQALFSAPPHFCMCSQNKQNSNLSNVLKENYYDQTCEKLQTSVLTQTCNFSTNDELCLANDNSFLNIVTISTQTNGFESKTEELPSIFPKEMFTVSTQTNNLKFLETYFLHTKLDSKSDISTSSYTNLSDVHHNDQFNKNSQESNNISILVKKEPTKDSNDPVINKRNLLAVRNNVKRLTLRKRAMRILKCSRIFLNRKKLQVRISSQKKCCNKISVDNLLDSSPNFKNYDSIKVGTVSKEHPLSSKVFPDEPPFLNSNGQHQNTYADETLEDNNNNMDIDKRSTSKVEASSLINSEKYDIEKTISSKDKSENDLNVSLIKKQVPANLSNFAQPSFPSKNLFDDPFISDSREEPEESNFSNIKSKDLYNKTYKPKLQQKLHISIDSQQNTCSQTNETAVQIDSTNENALFKGNSVDIVVFDETDFATTGNVKEGNTENSLKRKRGRPKKLKGNNEVFDGTNLATVGNVNTENSIKRKRGRPKKFKRNNKVVGGIDFITFGYVNTENSLKHKLGRPKKLKECSTLASSLNKNDYNHESNCRLSTSLFKEFQSDTAFKTVTSLQSKEVSMQNVQFQSNSNCINKPEQPGVSSEISINKPHEAFQFETNSISDFQQPKATFDRLASIQNENFQFKSYPTNDPEQPGVSSNFQQLETNFDAPCLNKNLHTKSNLTNELNCSNVFSDAYTVAQSKVSKYVRRSCEEEIISPDNQIQPDSFPLNSEKNDSKIEMNNFDKSINDKNSTLNINEIIALFSKFVSVVEEHLNTMMDNSTLIDKNMKRTFFNGIEKINSSVFVTKKTMNYDEFKNSFLPVIPSLFGSLNSSNYITGLNVNDMSLCSKKNLEILNKAFLKLSQRSYKESLEHVNLNGSTNQISNEKTENTTKPKRGRPKKDTKFASFKKHFKKKNYKNKSSTLSLSKALCSDFPQSCVIKSSANINKTLNTDLLKDNILYLKETSLKEKSKSLDEEVISTLSNPVSCLLENGENEKEQSENDCSHDISSKNENSLSEHNNNQFNILQSL